MNQSERTLLLDSYAHAYDKLIAAIAMYPREMWQWKPIETAWSIHEIIIHVADSEANSYIRCRRLIAEPGSAVLGYNENLWATHLHYHNQSIEAHLELFRLLRKLSYQLLLTLPEEVWSTATVMHSEKGLVTIDQWLRTYEEHIPVHILQMGRTYQAWLNR